MSKSTYTRSTATSSSTATGRSTASSTTPSSSSSSSRSTYSSSSTTSRTTDTSKTYLRPDRDRGTTTASSRERGNNTRTTSSGNVRSTEITSTRDRDRDRDRGTTTSTRTTDTSSTRERDRSTRSTDTSSRTTDRGRETTSSRTDRLAPGRVTDRGPSPSRGSTTSSSSSSTLTVGRSNDKRDRATSRTDRARMSALTTDYKSSSSSFKHDSSEANPATVARLTNKSSAGPQNYYKPIYASSATVVTPSGNPVIKKASEEYTAIVIDHGSKLLKVGVGGEMVPRYVCPSVMGKPRHPGFMAGMTKKDSYVGDEAQQKRDVLALSWPMELGLISNYDDANKIWSHAFKEIDVPPDDQPLVWTEASLIRSEQREKLAEIFFENHGIPAIHFALQSVLSVYSAGLATALVVDLGEKCDVTPVYEGGSFSHPQDSAIKRLKTTGSDITEHLEQILADRGYYFTTPAEREIVNFIKEQTAYVALSPDHEMTQEMTLIMPDGQPLTLGNERFRAPEALFIPALCGKEGDGLHAVIYHSIMDTGIDMRVEMARNILLAGGTSMIPGLGPRIEAELSKLAPSQRWEISVIAPNDRKYSAWIGGSIVASLDNFEKVCFSKDVYDEIGPSYLHETAMW